jgi:hypothetical protein
MTAAAAAALVASVAAAANPAVEFIGAAGTTAPASSVAVNAGTQAGDQVFVWGGNNPHVDVNFDTPFDLEDNDSGSGTCMGCGWDDSASGAAQTYAPSVELHRMATATFRNAEDIQSEAPVFNSTSTNIVFPGFPGGTVPGGGGRVLLAAYCTSTAGTLTAPTGFTTIRNNGFTPLFLSDTVLTTFTGATATGTNSVVSGKITAVVI